MNEQKPHTPKKPGKPKSKMRETVAEAFIELLKVKSLITFAVIGVMSRLAVTGAIAPETFMTIASAVVTYYFTRKQE
jgi:Na+-transporting NADH:ubiquinone oxidoreductase subunit NqrD